MKGSALSYLLLTRWKNQLLELKKHSGKLIYIIAMIALVGVTVFNGEKSSGGYGEQRDIAELAAGITALYAVIFVVMAKAGFGQGASMFTMSDVNLLFPSPLSSAKVLFFGLLQQIWTSLLLGFFLLFQYAWLHGLYGVSFVQLLFIMLGYTLTVFCGQLTAMAIYTFTSGYDARRGCCKLVFYLIVLLFAGWLLADAAMHRDEFFPRAVYIINTPLFRLFPVAGWISDIVSGSFIGWGTLAWAGLAAVATYIAAIVLAIVFSKADYYEDVLKTAELTHSAITAQKQGQLGDASPRNIKVGRTGFTRGWGADAFYYKHLIENRRARVFIVDTTSLVFCAVSILFAFFMKNVGIYAVFAFSVYMQIFSVALGRINKELTRPYVYMVPEPPFLKLWNCLREAFPGFIIEAAFVYIPVKFILGVPWTDVLCAGIARFMLSLLFSAGNILVERLFGTVSSKVLTFMFFFLSMAVLAAPGVVLAVVLNISGFVIASSTATSFLAMAVCNLPIAALVLFLCRNMLTYAELNYN